MRKSTFTILVFALLFVAGCQPQGGNVTDNETTACTMDAKICPDGSAVGREGPNCEFAACPGEDMVIDERIVVDRQEKGENEEVCSRIRFTCDEGYEYYQDEGACGCVQYGTPVEFKGENIACTKEYMPVCAWMNQSVQCITYPCAVTVGNKCEAQTIENVAYYTQGPCPPAGGKVGENSMLTYTYQPMQCDDLPWTTWLASATFPTGSTEEDYITGFYASKDIEVTDVQRVETDRMVCEACSICQTAHHYTLQARAGDKLTLTEDGWTTEEENADSRTGQDDEQRKYVSTDTEECKTLLFMCTDDRKPFFDETGCGCELK